MVCTMNEHTYDVIIVGGGMAGLTAAAYLSRAKKRVLLLEKNAEVGGLVNSFTRDGIHFDAGVRALEDAGIILPMLRDLNIKLKVVPSPVSLGIEDEILHIESLESLNQYGTFLKKFYPESQADIESMLKTIRRIMKNMDVLYGIENPVFMDLKRDTAYIFRKLLPWLPRFLLTIGRINRMQIPVEKYLATIIRNPSLRDIIAQHFFQGTPTFFALSYFSLYLDYFYPQGGVGKLADVLRNKILELGGEIQTNTTIGGVSARECTVTDTEGASYAYRQLVWAADLKTLYRIVDTDGLSAKVQTSFTREKAKLLQYKGGESVFTLFLELDAPLASLGSIAHGHFFYTPSRQGLGAIHREELNELLRNFDRLSKADILAWLDRFIALNTFEISIPGLKDPVLAPPGKTGLIVSFLAQYELFLKVQEAGWLEEFVAEIEERVISVLAKSVYPQLKDGIAAHFSHTPLSIHKRIASSEGAIVGWKFQAEMPVISSIQNAASAVMTPLPDIFQAGQWAYSPAGVPMSILTGKFAANKILKDKRRG